MSETQPYLRIQNGVISGTITEGWGEGWEKRQKEYEREYERRKIEKDRGIPIQTARKIDKMTMDQRVARFLALNEQMQSYADSTRSLSSTELQEYSELFAESADILAKKCPHLGKTTVIHLSRPPQSFSIIQQYHIGKDLEARKKMASSVGTIDDVDLNVSTATNPSVASHRHPNPLQSTSASVLRSPLPVDSGRQQNAGTEPPSVGVGSNAADALGGHFLSLDVKGCKSKELVCADYLAPTGYLVPDGRGYIPFRHNTLLLRAYDANGGGNCLLEGLMVASGMGISKLGVNASTLQTFVTAISKNPEHGPSMGQLDQHLQAVKSPFRLPALDKLNGNRKWTALLSMVEGIFLVLALVKYTEGALAGKTGGHFIVYDAWRDLFIIGPGHGVLRVEPQDKADETRARTFLLEHYSLVVPLRVCQLVVAANRVSETPFNTPEHYAELEAKRLRKIDTPKRKADSWIDRGGETKRARTT